MSVSVFEDCNELDREWVQLMAKAKGLGYSADEVRVILAAMQEGSVEDVREQYV